jgi:streptogramin lyase
MSTHPRLKNNRRNFTLLRALTSTKGAIDLASIMVGVIVIGIIAGVIAATVFAVIPWAQDNAAKQSLDAVKTAESVAATKDTAGYVNGDTLTSNGYLPSSKSLTVNASPTGKCYTAASKSATGTIFYGSSVDTTIQNSKQTGPISFPGCDAGTPVVAGAPTPPIADPHAGLSPIVTTIAGDSTNGTQGNVNGVGTAAEFNNPHGVTVSSNGVTYVADTGSNQIRAIATDGTVSTFAGTGDPGDNDGALDTATFSSPVDITIDPAGNFWITDGGPGNGGDIREITPAGVVSTISGFHALTLDMYLPSSITSDAAGDVFVADQYGANIQERKADGTFVVVAPDFSFIGLSGLVAGSDGNLYASDYAADTISKIASDGTITVIAGSTAGNADGTGTSAQFSNPKDLAIDASGNLYVIDDTYNEVREITPDGTVTTIAGFGPNGNTDGPLGTATLSNPYGIAVAANGSVVFTDTGYSIIRTITWQ